MNEILKENIRAMQSTSNRKDLEKVEELTRALQDGKTLVCIDDERYTWKQINGVVVEYFKNNPHCFNASIMFNNCIVQGKEQEPEPEFEITLNQLAEYECRDGSKAVCYGEFNNSYVNYPYRIMFKNGHSTYVSLKGNVRSGVENPQDLVRKIRDL